MQTLLENTQAYRLLKRESEENRLSHAYLLLWDDPKILRSGIKFFAKLFFLQAGEVGRVSRLINGENFADCVFLPEEGKKLTVEDAERIKEESQLRPVEGEKKLFVLTDFSQANAQTQNKLLKLLEEPPKGVYFLLGATSSFSILPTVLSRTKTLEIQPFSVEDAAKYLYRLYGDKYDEGRYTFCAVASGGKIGEAQDALKNDEYARLLESGFALALTPQKKLPALVRQMGECKKQKELLSLLRLVFRDALLLKMQTERGEQVQKRVLLKTETEKLSAVAKGYSFAALLFAQEAISAAEKQVTFNAVFPQCLELCIASIQQKNGK